MLDNIEKLKKTRSVVFKFESLRIHLFFLVMMQFPGMTNREWNNKNWCTMSLVTHHYRRQREEEIVEYTKKMIKYLQTVVKQRYKVLLLLVEKYKDISFMVETYVTCMETLF